MRAGLLGLAVLLYIFHHVTGQDKKMFCYYSSDARWRPSYGKFQPKEIDPFLCTHVIVAFGKVLPDGLGPNTVKDDAPDGWNALYKKTVALKKRNPKLRVLLAVGGWKVGSKPFLPAISNWYSMDKWAGNAVKYLRLHGMDGMDMDWEFPGVRGSVPEDKYEFTTFMECIQEHFRRDAHETGREKMILTLATAAGIHFIENGYEPKEIHKHVDYMLLMTYNYHGLWEQNVGHHSSLTPSHVDVGERRNLSQIWTVKYWKDQGVPHHKLILGLATYGMSYTLLNAERHDLGANATGGGEGGWITREKGILAYFEICENLRNSNWRSEWIPEQQSPYAYGGNQWVGYDDVRSIEKKARYINEANLGGAFIWSVEMDDFSGKGCYQGKYPLLRKISEVIRPAGGRPPPPKPTWGPPPTRKPNPQPTRAPPPFRPPTRRPRPSGPFPSINKGTPDEDNGCYGEVALVPNPNNCHKYYHCTPHRAFEMSCGSFMGFNPVSSTCDYCFNVANCDCPAK